MSRWSSSITNGIIFRQFKLFDWWNERIGHLGIFFASPSVLKCTCHVCVLGYMNCHSRIFNARWKLFSKHVSHRMYQVQYVYLLLQYQVWLYVLISLTVLISLFFCLVWIRKLNLYVCMWGSKMGIDHTIVDETIEHVGKWIHTLWLNLMHRSKYLTGTWRGFSRIFVAVSNKAR